MRTALVNVRSREVPPPKEAAERNLTPREEGVLGLITFGKCNKEIATALGITERTVKFHMTHLFQKFGITSRLELLSLLSQTSRKR